MSSHSPFICEPVLVFGALFLRIQSTRFFFFFFGAQIPPALVPPWTRVHPGILASKQIPYSPFRLALTFLDLHGSSE